MNDDGKNDGMYLRICAIRKNNNGWEFSDCNGESLKAPDKKSIFTSSMNKRYRKERKKYIVDENTACVWFLRGTADNGDKTCIQVGRTKNLTNLLSNDIKEDIKTIAENYEVVLVEGQSVLADFALLQKFTNFVIGNSTFAWWGAMLANASNVIVPKKPWKIEMENMSPYPDNWTTI